MATSARERQQVAAQGRVAAVSAPAHDRGTGDREHECHERGAGRRAAPGEELEHCHPDRRRADEQHAARDRRVLERGDPRGEMHGQQDACAGRARARPQRSRLAPTMPGRARTASRRAAQARRARRRWRAAAHRRGARRSRRPRRRAARCPARRRAQPARSRRPATSCSGDGPGRHLAPAAREAGIELPPARLDASPRGAQKRREWFMCRV